MRFVRRGVRSLALLVSSGAVALTAFAPQVAAQGLVGDIAMDGSSTVFPITEAVAEEFTKLHPGVSLTVGISGTGGGFRRFCLGETDLNNASRPIRPTEVDACALNGIEYVEVPVGLDGLSVMVHPSNTWVDCITVSELNTIWSPASQGVVTSWNQVNPAWPATPLSLYGPGSDSWTFDYFTEEITGAVGASRGDFIASEDDNILVQGIAGDPNSLGYFGYAYYEANSTALKLLAIDAQDGRRCIYPSRPTIADGSYAPLSRPLLIYVNSDSIDDELLNDFVFYYLAQGVALVDEVGYVSLPLELYTCGIDRVQRRTPGTEYLPGTDGLTLIERYCPSSLL